MLPAPALPSPVLDATLRPSSSLPASHVVVDEGRGSLLDALRAWKVKVATAALWILIALAGAGIRGGQVYGASDKHGAFPADNPVSPGAFAATLYHCLGVPADAEIPDRLGRPVKVAEGMPVPALIS